MFEKTCTSSHVLSQLARAATLCVLYGLTAAAVGCGDDVIEDPSLSDSSYENSPVAPRG